MLVPWYPIALIKPVLESLVVLAKTKVLLLSLLAKGKCGGAAVITVDVLTKTRLVCKESFLKRGFC